MRLCTAQEIFRMEECAKNEHGIFPNQLMDRAAEGLYEALVHDTPSLPEDVLILCGPGNNGADGYTLAALCRQRGMRATIIAVTEPKSELCRTRAFESNTLSSPLFSFEGSSRALCLRLIEKATVIVDCVYGIGYDAAREPDERFVDLVRALSQSDAFILSCDVPSGLCSDTGRFCQKGTMPVLVFADETVTFSYSKPALETAPGLQAAGRVRVFDVGIPKEAADSVSSRSMLIDRDICRILTARKADTSKANYGKLFSYCGSRDMPGAAYLSATGALRCGIGLLTCAADPDTSLILKHRLAEPIHLCFAQTAEGENDLPRTRELFAHRIQSQSGIVVGCGIGTGKEQESLLETLLCESACPVVCDADAITLLAARPDLMETYGEKLILTPHPGEMARLAHVAPRDIQLNRIDTALSYAKHTGAVVVLKGHRTVVASPDGRLAINQTGNPGMAKGGSGDLLAGMLGAFVSQALPAFEAACLAVYLHGRAGDLARDALGEVSMLPSDIARYISHALTE